MLTFALGFIKKAMGKRGSKSEYLIYSTINLIQIDIFSSTEKD